MLVELKRWIRSKFRKHPSPPEQAASRLVEFLFSDVLPGLKAQYEALWIASDGELKIVLLDLQTEMLLFALHCLDRAVLANWGEAYRERFMNSALAATHISFRNSLPSSFSALEKLSLVEHLGDHYNMRQCEYSSMKMFSDGNTGSLENVLWWEFGKRFCLTADVNNPAMIVLMAKNAQSYLTMMTKIARTL